MPRFADDDDDCNRCRYGVQTQKKKRARSSRSRTTTYHKQTWKNLNPPPVMTTTSVPVISSASFAVLATPHPYGVLPEGNQFFNHHHHRAQLLHDCTCTSVLQLRKRLTGSSNVNVRVSASTCDEVWYKCLEYCNAVDLGRVLQSCRYLYALASQPELWRDIRLRLFPQTKAPPPSPGPDCHHDHDDVAVVDDFPVGGSWKDAVVQQIIIIGDQYDSSRTRAREAQQQPLLHVPMPIPGLYSDFLYRLHATRSFALPSSWLLLTNETTTTTTTTTTMRRRSEEVPRIPWQDMTTERFVRDFERPNRPVVIAGGASTWPACRRWCDLEYLVQQTTRQNAAKTTTSTTTTTSSSPAVPEPVVFRATSGTAPLPAQFTMAAYLKYCSSTHSTLEEMPLYLFDRDALVGSSSSTTTNTTQPQQPPPLWNDYMPDLQRTCPYWDPATLHPPPNPQSQAPLRPPPSSTTTATATAETHHPHHDDEDLQDYHPYHDLFQVLESDPPHQGRQRPDHTWLIVGPPRSGSVFHVDPNATHAWNACIVGAKRWILYPPTSSLLWAGATTTCAFNNKKKEKKNRPPPGVHPSNRNDEVTLPLSIGEWLLQFWDAHEARKRQAHSRDNHEDNHDDCGCYNGPLECTTFAGDIIFVPHLWWHSVINIDDSVNIAITHNYVSASNLHSVGAFLRRYPDQVSGCSDRRSIRKEDLLDTFVQKMKEAQLPESLIARALLQDDTEDHNHSNEMEEIWKTRQKKKKLHLTSKGSSTSIMSKAKASLRPSAIVSPDREYEIIKSSTTGTSEPVSATAAPSFSFSFQT